MHYLTHEQISSISDKLKEQDVDYSHLFDDLLDHVCCDIEISMQEGLNYNQASQNIFERIGLNGLREIQEATIFYVKLNLIVMKKLMNVLAIIGTVVLFIGLFFKSMHLPGGSVFFTLAMLILFFGFFPTALLSVRKEMKVNLFSKEFGVYLVGFLTLFINGLAIAFTTMHWPGGNLLVIASWILLFLFFFHIIFYRVIKSKSNKIINLSLAIFAFLFMGTSTVYHYNQKTNVYKAINYESINEELMFYKKNLQTSISFENHTYKEHQQLLVEIENMIGEYESLALNGSNNIYIATRSYGHNSPVNSEFDNGFNSLKDKLTTYHNLSLELSHGNLALQKLINNKFSTKPLTINSFGEISWWKRNFNSHGQAGITHIYISLHKILKDAYQIEYEILRNNELKEAPEL